MTGKNTDENLTAFENHMCLARGARIEAEEHVCYALKALEDIGIDTEQEHEERSPDLKGCISVRELVERYAFGGEESIVDLIVSIRKIAGLA